MWLFETDNSFEINIMLLHQFFINKYLSSCILFASDFYKNNLRYQQILLFYQIIKDALKAKSSRANVSLYIILLLTETENINKHHYTNT